MNSADNYISAGQNKWCGIVYLKNMKYEWQSLMVWQIIYALTKALFWRLYGITTQQNFRLNRSSWQYIYQLHVT